MTNKSFIKIKNLREFHTVYSMEQTKEDQYQGMFGNIISEGKRRGYDDNTIIHNIQKYYPDVHDLDINLIKKMIHYSDDIVEDNFSKEQIQQLRSNTLNQIKELVNTFKMKNPNSTYNEIKDFLLIRGYKEDDIVQVIGERPQENYVSAASKEDLTTSNSGSLLTTILPKKNNSKNRKFLIGKIKKMIQTKENVEISEKDFPMSEFNKGLKVELEHAETLDFNIIKVAKTVLDHLDEDLEYYTKLETIEKH